MARNIGLRRSVLMVAAFAGVAATALAPGASLADDSNGGVRVASGVPAPTPGSPRARLLAASTLDALHLVQSSSTGRLGREYTEAQLATAARLYDIFTWQHAGSGVTGFLHQLRPDMIVMQYADISWMGGWDILPGLKWQPFDWGYVDAHENFFSHSVAAKPWDEKNRIGYGYTPFLGANGWLMNPFDLDAEQPANLEHWVNYYAAHVRSLIESESMDGVSIDELMQPYSIPPDGFDPDAWHEALKRALAFMREQWGPDVVVLWNGLTQDMPYWAQDIVAGKGWIQPRSLDYLQWADMPVFECFATCYSPFPEVWPLAAWEQMMDLAAEVQRRGGVLLAQSKFYEKARMFSIASFYLVKGERAYFCESGFTDNGGVDATIWWLPEFGVAMGKPLAFGEHITDYLVLPGRRLGVSGATGTVYARPYEKGVVLANPSEEDADVALGRSGYIVRAEGGGAILSDGSLPAGKVTFEPAETVHLGPHDGALVVWNLP